MVGAQSSSVISSMIWWELKALLQGGKSRSMTDQCDIGNGVMKTFK